MTQPAWPSRSTSVNAGCSSYRMAIGTPTIRNEAVELVKLGLAALDELKNIDETLYGLFVASKQQPADPEMAAAKLRLIWDGAFRPLASLLEYSRRLVEGLIDESCLGLQENREQCRIAPRIFEIAQMLRGHLAAFASQFQPSVLMNLKLQALW